MQYLRQSLLTICICLYSFLAIVLGLSFLVGRSDASEVVGFYHPELPFEALTELELVHPLEAPPKDPTLAELPLAEEAASAEPGHCLGERCL